MSLTQDRPSRQAKRGPWPFLPVTGTYACGHPILPSDGWVYDTRLTGDENSPSDKEHQTRFVESRNCRACGMSPAAKQRARKALGLTEQMMLPKPTADPLVPCDECGVCVPFSTCRVTQAPSLICLTCDGVELSDFDVIERAA